VFYRGVCIMDVRKQLIAIALIVSSIAIAVVAPLAMASTEQQNVLAAAPNVDVAKYTPEVAEGLPRHISVPSLGVETDVADGTYDLQTGQWSLTEATAFHATVTPIVNAESGNTLIYGRNSQEVFSKLTAIQPGSDVVVTTDSGYTFTYTYLANKADGAPIQYNGKPRLTLQVCSGDRNQTHQMFYSELKNYSKE
jgi:hypothetical protein